ncbi:MAG TPA: class I SAM-dependent methyltransferase [Bacteroidales bacterium]|nr:class I SAM-dependent methyltransferase [Bacteroidales bacterium]
MNGIKILKPANWVDYELIDSGNGEKLERFGKYVLRRPEPQALWGRSMPESEWIKFAHATFRREKSQNKDQDKGIWELKPGMPEQWYIQYSLENTVIKLRLGLTSFKHVGVFPEQAENWDYIYRTISCFQQESVPVLNLFAYTGGASLVAKAAGADVVHVDSVKQVINWSAGNMEASNLNGIRWVVEDAMKFIRREVKRGKVYNGIILDPPAYGRGPDGEKWILEDQIDEMIGLCSKLLEKNNAFLILNLYSMGFSAIIAENIIRSHFPDIRDFECGELCVQERSQRLLPLGIFMRFKR